MNAAASKPQVLSVQDLVYAYRTADGEIEAISDLSFAVHEGEFVSIVGPSGSGKTTLMKIVAGLLQATKGSVRILGKPLTGRVPDGVALVFQDYSRSLFPWMTVQRNVEFPLSHRRASRADVAQRSRESLSAVGLVDFATRYPWELSGGMQQRVAIARALAFRPRLLLMDEPFASVDAQTRADLEDLVADVHQQFGTTILFVTHDIDESVYLSDRVLVLSAHPARLLLDREVPLSRPRDQVATRELHDFVRLRAEIAGLILRPGTEKTASSPQDTSPGGR
ncbi:MAG: ABC transporter ATP-binding protein [Thermaerobacter sp.]|nr:ABC transporter ATP-binding protein [Thermaerobacter sp.]